MAPALVAALAACAQPGIPPGGPPDREAPVLTGVTPDTGAVNVRTRSVILRFDEVVNERSQPITASGARGATTVGGGMGGGFGAGAGMGSTLGSLVLLSPGDGRERVSWRRTAIEIEPRGGFRPNTTYRVTLLPGLSDLRGNVLREQVDVVFSTGPTRTSAVVRGAVFDWVAGKVAPNARVELFAPGDSTLRWSARADSSGRFAVQDLAPGMYRLRGWMDVNSNRLIDPREVFDSTTVTVDTALTAELYAFVHDTLGPRIESLEPRDSTALRVKFDRGVATGWTPDDSTVVLMANDSSVVPVRDLIPLATFDSLQSAERARADSARADSTRARGDTVPAADTTARAAAPGARAGAPRVPGAPPGGRPAAAGEDTTLGPPPPALNRPVPVLEWVVRFQRPLPPGTYRVKFARVPSLLGRSQPTEREFRIRPPEAPKDSTQAAPAAPGSRPPSAPATRPPATRPPAERPRPEARRP